MLGNFTTNIKPYVEAELQLARTSYVVGDYSQAFKYLENAHVLGQESTYFHVKVHCIMFYWALRQRDIHELLGQTFRVIGAATKTAIGLVPSGNTGGADVSPFKVMPIKEIHANYIENAKSGV
ncbi:hypothetical protein CMT41_17740 [Colwellia sp. MT41]|uniref:DUF3703 domain-containing protein n=1 Tax=Colwellia sp. MT41 TaxID=58049 RepID=UPI000717A4E0|nr:DUF3703 domain-containing protein [Colwellia sp. MT41]ALO36376.1 hypothetical protein CMT41_17740 [Colwellia sp. MT41]